MTVLTSGASSPLEMRELMTRHFSSESPLLRSSLRINSPMDRWIHPEYRATRDLHCFALPLPGPPGNNHQIKNGKIEDWNEKNYWDNGKSHSPSICNSPLPSDAIWWHRSGSILAQVMACCLMAPSHYMNQCWLPISEVLRPSPESNLTVSAQATVP